MAAPKSTAVVATQTVDQASTGAVEYQAPGETRVEHYNSPVVVSWPNPEPSTTVTVSWLDKAEAKVVEPAEQSPAPKKTRTARTKSGGVK